MREKTYGTRLPLDLLLILDVSDLDEALICKYALEHENEIQFCRNDEDLKETLSELEDDEAVYYEIDEIEHDRIQAVIDLLNKAEADNILGHILDRVVR
jgi:hypothetical protein